MSIDKTCNVGRLDGRASITNHCITLNEGAQLVANACDIVLRVQCAQISFIGGRWSRPLYHSTLDCNRISMEQKHDIRYWCL